MSIMNVAKKKFLSVFFFLFFPLFELIMVLRTHV
jgi:hypothetical protein